MKPSSPRLEVVETGDAPVEPRAPLTDVPLLPGELIGQKYELVEHMAVGGQALIWRARHVALDRLVVLKILRSDLAHDAGIALRFVDEARILASLDNEHIARILDYGRAANGVPFMVMEHLEGRDLRSVLGERGALPEDAAARYVLEACLGMQEAHRAGIVHRDLKPENLFVCSRNDRVKVLDFGVSKATHVERHLTHPGQPVGSPAYMAPEQLLSSDEVDERCDVWALGAVLYELLTGVCPFDAPSIAETCARVLQQEPKAASEFGPSLSPGLAQVVMQCLAKNVEERVKSVESLAALIAPYAMANEPRPNGGGLPAKTSHGTEPLAPLRPKQELTSVLEQEAIPLRVPLSSGFIWFRAVSLMLLLAAITLAAVYAPWWLPIMKEFASGIGLPMP